MGKIDVEADGAEKFAKGFSLVLPASWEHFRIADRPERELSARLSSYVSRGANPNLVRRLKASLLSSMRSLRENGTTDMYLPYVTSDDDVPIPASLIATPVQLPSSGIEGLVATFGGTADCAIESMNSGTNYIFPNVTRTDVSGIGSVGAGSLTSIVEMPRKGNPSALVFHFAIIEPDALGRERVDALQMLFLVMMHSVMWEL